MKKILLTVMIYFITVILTTCSPTKKNAPPAPPPPPYSFNADESVQSEKAQLEKTVVFSDAQVRKMEEKEFVNTKITQIESSEDGTKVKAKRPTKTKKFVKKNEGLLVYNIPDTMEYRKWYTVKFRINKDVHDTSSIIKDFATVSVHTIKVSSVMEVKITDPREAFKIVKSNTDRQLVDTTGYTEWVYDIFTLKAGTHPLHVVVSVIREGQPKELVYVNDIYVKAKFSKKIGYTTTTFFEKYWQWLASTLVIPFFIWWYNRKKKKKKC